MLRISLLQQQLRLDMSADVGVYLSAGHELLSMGALAAIEVVDHNSQRGAAL